MSTRARWTSVDRACVVEIAPVVLSAITRMADDAHPEEIGSSLYGSYSDDQWLARVEGIAPVPADSARGRFHFRRGVDGLTVFFRRLFARTRGESFYVGEFHSHPGGAASPSAQDDAAQFAIAGDPRCQCEAPVLVIVGGVPGARELGVFVHPRYGRRFALLAER